MGFGYGLEYGSGGPYVLLSVCRGIPAGLPGRPPTELLVAGSGYLDLSADKWDRDSNDYMTTLEYQVFFWKCANIQVS
jgi:hypothetical protein